jgi:hypothetical protein
MSVFRDEALSLRGKVWHIMADQVSDFLLKRLSEWGIKLIYGIPGDGSEW